MSNKDIVSKATIRRLAIDLATYLLKLPIDPDSLEVLATEHQRVEDRRADLVVRLRDRQGKPFLLHIEIHKPFLLHIEIQNIMPLRGNWWHHQRQG
uniref:Transposase, YhgA-like n=1 Tax=Candidatus Kentrum sp. FW TaxID=2126338 RepID=A0A450TBN4_9GAMM|nr:MAG: hypothetical protein BECKFW1821A_GA0114235_11656 [Candidatus Kentron sp. FW]